MSEFEWVAAAIVSVVSAARITRLVTVDDLPPAKWLRHKYDELTGSSDWSLLMFCGYCFGVWAGFGVVLWGWLVDFDTAWWVFNGGMSVAYLAAILMAHDGDD
jgi:hypothetical protein